MPGQEDAIVRELEQPLNSRHLRDVAPGLEPDFDSLLQRSGLPDTRTYDHSFDGLSEEEVVVLGKEDDLRVSEMFADTGV